MTIELIEALLMILFMSFNLKIGALCQDLFKSLMMDETSPMPNQALKTQFSYISESSSPLRAVLALQQLEQWEEALTLFLTCSLLAFIVCNSNSFDEHFTGLDHSSSFRFVIELFSYSLMCLLLRDMICSHDCYEKIVSLLVS